MMGASLADMKEWLKDFTFGKRIRNFKVMCTVTAVGFDDNNEACDKNQLKNLMTADPMHLAAAGYEKLAKGMLKKLESGLTRPGKRKPDDVLENDRKRADLSKKRASWVSMDDVTAIRSDPWGSRGS
jgi:hypothetical protein